MAHAPGGISKQGAGGYACQVVGRDAREVRRHDPRNRRERDKEMSETTKDEIRLVMLFGMTPKQEAEIRQAAAKAGVAPIIYLYNLVRTEPERFIVPLPVEAASLAPAPAG